MPFRRKRASKHSETRQYTRKSLINGLTIEKNSLFQAESENFVNDFFEEHGLIDISETNVGMFIEWEDDPENSGMKITPKFPPVFNKKLAIYWEYVGSVFQKIRDKKMKFEDAEMFGSKNFGRDYTIEEDHEMMCLWAGIDKLEGRFLGSTQPYRDFNETFRKEINKVNLKIVEKCELHGLTKGGIKSKEISEMAKDNLKNVRKNEGVIRKLCASFLRKFHEVHGSEFLYVDSDFCDKDLNILKEAIPAFGLTRKDVEKIYLDSFESPDIFKTSNNSDGQSTASRLESLSSIFESGSNINISSDNDQIDEESTPFISITQTGETKEGSSEIMTFGNMTNSDVVTMDMSMTPNTEMNTSKKSSVTGESLSGEKSSGERSSGEKSSDDLFGDISSASDDNENPVDQNSELVDFKNLNFDCSSNDVLKIDNLDI